MADNRLNAVNRGVYISDNLPFLQGLNDECIDLVCIDPPFAKNETFGRKNSKSPDPLKPPLSDEEKATEMALLQRWGIKNQQDAANAGIDWPETKYKDIWSWQDVHESWLKNIEDYHPGVHKLIEATQEIHGDSTAAYLCYMAVRLFEIRRVLKDNGSLYLHCDHTAGAYLRQLRYAQGQPAECCRASASVGSASRRLAPCQGRPRPRSRRDPPPNRPGRDRQASPQWYSFAPPSCRRPAKRSRLTGQR